MANNIKLLKLLTGEEIIAEVLNYVEGDSKVTFKNPLRVLIMPSKTDPKTPTVGLVGWGEFVDEKEFKLDKSHILYIMKPIQEFMNQYNSVFGGIVAPSSKLILPGS